MSGLIVVGVDGSESARLAARWAAREGEIRGAAVLLLSAWDMPTYGFSFGAAAFSEDLLKALRKTAEGNVADAMDEIREISKDVDASTELWRVRRRPHSSRRPGTRTFLYSDPGASEASGNCCSDP